MKKGACASRKTTRRKAAENPAVRVGGINSVGSANSTVECVGEKMQEGILKKNSSSAGSSPPFGPKRVRTCAQRAPEPSQAGRTFATSAAHGPSGSAGDQVIVEGGPMPFYVRYGRKDESVGDGCEVSADDRNPSQAENMARRMEHQLALTEELLENRGEEVDHLKKENAALREENAALRKENSELRQPVALSRSSADAEAASVRAVVGMPAASSVAASARAQASVVTPMTAPVGESRRRVRNRSSAGEATEVGSIVETLSARVVAVSEVGQREVKEKVVRPVAGPILAVPVEPSCEPPKLAGAAFRKALGQGTAKQDHPLKGDPGRLKPLLKNIGAAVGKWEGSFRDEQKPTQFAKTPELSTWFVKNSLELPVANFRSEDWMNGMAELMKLEANEESLAKRYARGEAEEKRVLRRDARVEREQRKKRESRSSGYQSDGAEASDARKNVTDVRRTPHRETGPHVAANVEKFGPDGAMEKKPAKLNSFVFVGKPIP